MTLSSVYSGWLILSLAVYGQPEIDPFYRCSALATHKHRANVFKVIITTATTRVIPRAYATVKFNKTLWMKRCHTYLPSLMLLLLVLSIKPFCAWAVCTTGCGFFLYYSGRYRNLHNQPGEPIIGRPYRRLLCYAVTSESHAEESPQSPLHRPAEMTIRNVHFQYLF